MAAIASFSPYTYSVALLCCVLLSKFILLKYGVKHRPWHAFDYYCIALSQKVNNPSRTFKQQQLSGFIATLITLLPIITILEMFSLFIEIAFLWHAVLLYFALDGIDALIAGNKINQSLSQQNKYGAKEQLAPFVLRDIKQLSVLGITKASIEMQLLRVAQQLFTVAFYFLVFGPLTALTIRLILELQYSWNIKKEKFAHFGKVIHYISSLLQWLPTRLLYCTFGLMSGSKNLLLFWRLTKAQIFTLGNDIIIASLALVMGVQLGGVAMYEREKLQKKRFNNNARQVEIVDIKNASSFIKQIIALYLLMLCIPAVLLVVLTS